MGLHRSNLLASVRAGGNAQLLDVVELLHQGDPGGNAPTAGAGGTPGKHSPIENALSFNPAERKG